MIVKEIEEIKKIIQQKKLKFQKSHINFQELNQILGKENKNKPNLMLELTAHEILSDLKFLEIIQQVFEVDLAEFIKTMNQDFQVNDLFLEITDTKIENFEDIKLQTIDYLKNIKNYYEKKFENVQKIMSKQDVDIDEMSNEFKIVEKLTRDKLEVKEAAFKKLETKYLEILIYIKEKISN